MRNALEPEYNTLLTIMSWQQTTSTVSIQIRMSVSCSLKTYSSEGHDRVEWEADWNSTVVIKNVTARCSNTIVVTYSAGINTMPGQRIQTSPLLSLRIYRESRQEILSLISYGEIIIHLANSPTHFQRRSLTTTFRWSISAKSLHQLDSRQTLQKAR